MCLFLSLSSLILPLSGVEESTLEALGTVDKGHHEDVGQRSFDGHEDLVTRGEREVRGRGFRRRRGRHLASSLELLRAERVQTSQADGVWCDLVYGTGAYAAPLLLRYDRSRERERQGAALRRVPVSSYRVSCAAPRRAATHRPLVPRLFPLFGTSVSFQLAARVQAAAQEPDDAKEERQRGHRVRAATAAGSGRMRSGGR